VYLGGHNSNNLNMWRLLVSKSRLFVLISLLFIREEIQHPFAESIESYVLKEKTQKN
jgi:hypothetical protein